MMNSCPSILLVEDNPLDVDLTLRAFEQRNLANPILVARDGEKALAWVPRWESGEAWPTIILLDLKLPKIDGLVVLETLKTHVLLRCIPVVALTSSREDRDVQTAYDLGVNSYIVKPVGFDNFMDVMQQIKLYWCVLNELSG